MPQLHNIDTSVLQADNNMADEKQRASHQQKFVTPETRAEAEASEFQSDQALICACRKGDTRAWGIMLDRYERLVFTIALHYGLGQHDATAIARLTFTLLRLCLDQLTENNCLVPWLADVARCLTFDLLEHIHCEDVNGFKGPPEMVSSTGQTETNLGLG